LYRAETIEIDWHVLGRNHPSTTALATFDPSRRCARRRGSAGTQTMKNAPADKSHNDSAAATMADFLAQGGLIVRVIGMMNAGRLSETSPSLKRV